MVNFRFHLISIIAVFLALGLGILMGSTVIDEAIVDRLDREIESVRTESDELRTENAQLRDDLDRVDTYVADSAAMAVEDRLDNVPVVILAERAVGGEMVDATAALIRAAGADAPAVIWLEDRWMLDDQNSIETLRGTLDTATSAASVRDRALDALARRIAEPPAAPEASDAGEEPVPDLLTRLSDAGFIDVQGDDVDLATFPAGPSRAIVVTGTDSLFSESDLTVALTQALVEADVSSVVGEVFVAGQSDDAPERGDAIAPVREDDTLNATVSTVDDLDLVAGRVASVLALEDLATGTVGHYGYGRGADQIIPAAVR